jgi:hypothetical protein
MEASVPQLYRSLSSPSTIGSRPDPARRAGKMHGSERGPRARKAGHHPTGGARSTGPPGAEGAPLGVHESESTKGHLYPSDSDRLPPERPGSQSDAAAARRYGAGTGRREFRDCVGTHGACSRTRHHLSRNCPTRRPRLIDPGRRLPPFVGCFRSTP